MADRTIEVKRNSNVSLVGYELGLMEPQISSDNLSFWCQDFYHNISVTKYFNINMHEFTDEDRNEDECLNFYVGLNLTTNKIFANATIQYGIDNPDGLDYFDWELLTEEETYIREQMNEYFKKYENTTLEKWIEEKNIEDITEEFER